MVTCPHPTTHPVRHVPGVESVDKVDGQMDTPNFELIASNMRSLIAVRRRLTELRGVEPQPDSERRLDR